MVSRWYSSKIVSLNLPQSPYIGSLDRQSKSEAISSRRVCVWRKGPSCFDLWVGRLIAGRQSQVEPRLVRQSLLNCQPSWLWCRTQRFLWRNVIYSEVSLCGSWGLCSYAGMRKDGLPMPDSVLALSAAHCEVQSSAMRSLPSSIVLTPPFRYRLLPYGLRRPRGVKSPEGAGSTVTQSASSVKGRSQ